MHKVALAFRNTSKPGSTDHCYPIGEIRRQKLKTDNDGSIKIDSYENIKKLINWRWRDNLFNLHYHLVNLIQFMCHARQHMNVYICTCSTCTVHTFMHCCTCTTRTSTYPSISRVLQYYCNTTYYVCMVPVPACSLQGNMSALKKKSQSLTYIAVTVL